MADLGSLDPRFSPAARWFVGAAQAAGFEVTVTSARRSWAQQDQLYQEFLAGERDLPALPPDRSLHVRGLAFDAVVDGNYRGRAQAVVGQAWRRMGGEWGPSDPVHFQAPRWWRDEL